VLLGKAFSAEARLSLLAPKDLVSCNSETEVAGPGSGARHWTVLLPSSHRFSNSRHCSRFATRHPAVRLHPIAGWPRAIGRRLALWDDPLQPVPLGRLQQLGSVIERLDQVKAMDIRTRHKLRELQPALDQIFSPS